MSELSAFYKRLPEIMEKVVTPMGRFQYAVALMLCYNEMIVGLNNVVSSFYTYQPDFHCNVRKAQSVRILLRLQRFFLILLES